MLLADVLNKVNGPEWIRIRNRENREMIYEGFRGTMEHYIPVDDWIRWEVVNIHVSVDWKLAVSSAVVAGVISILTSVAGIPEVKCDDEK